MDAGADYGFIALQSGNKYTSRRIRLQHINLYFIYNRVAADCPDIIPFLFLKNSTQGKGEQRYRIRLGKTDFRLYIHACRQRGSRSSIKSQAKPIELRGICLRSQTEHLHGD